MKNWQEFQQAEPILLRIESRFQKLKRFESRYPASEANLHGFDEEDIILAKEALLESIKSDVASIPGKVYYWLYPFYGGNFLHLVAALGACGAMEKQRDDERSRNAFYQFFKTVPIDERLQLGERLNQPELTEQAKRIQARIQAKRKTVQDFMDKNHAN